MPVTVGMQEAYIHKAVGLHTQSSLTHGTNRSDWHAYAGP